MESTAQQSIGSTFTNPQGSLPSTLTTPETEQKEQLIQYHDLENTPFTIVETNERCFLSWGKWKLTDDMETVDDVKAYLNECQWAVIGAWFVALSEARQIEIEAQKNKLGN